MGDDRSAACRLGTPGERHRCIGCGCTCHLVRAPSDFRSRVERRRKARRNVQSELEIGGETAADRADIGSETDDREAT